MIFDVDRFKLAIATIVREIVADMVGLPGVYEYRVSKAESGKLTARAAERAVGLPDLVEIPIRGSVIGGQSLAKLKGGVSVLVGFVNGDRGRPYLAHGPDDTEPVETGLKASGKITVDAGGALDVNAASAATIDAPTVTINGGAQGAARLGDTILAAGIFAGSITSGSATTKIG